MAAMERSAAGFFPSQLFHITTRWRAAETARTQSLAAASPRRPRWGLRDAEAQERMVDGHEVARRAGLVDLDRSRRGCGGRWCRGGEVRGAQDRLGVFGGA